MLSLFGSIISSRGGFVQNSLRFRSSASANLSRTFAGPTSSTVFTWSAWVKRGALTGTYRLFGASTNTFLTFNSSDQLNLTLNGTSAATSTAVFRDPSAWYHIVYAQNGAAQTLYVNQASVATGTTANTVFNTAIAHQIGAANTASFFDGYLTEVNFIDGQALTASSFGQIETTTGVWSPKQYVGSYGTNGFYLKFNNTSSVAALGTDSSGNGNTWTVNNVSLTAGATYDSMVDVPVNYSDSGNGRGNYAVWNAIAKSGSASTTDGNLGNSLGSSSSDALLSSMAIDTKAYAEFYGSIFASAVRFVGVAETATGSNNAQYYSDGRLYINNSLQGTYATYGSGDIVSVDCDPSTRQVRVYKNNVQISSTGTVSGTAPLFFTAGGSGGGTGSSTGGANFGQRPFTYTPPAGFKALNTNNLPTPSIVNGANFMAATTYTGNAAARSLSNAVNNVSFQPDLVWIKSRTPGATNHALFDSSRGVTKYLSSNTTTTETTLAQSLTAFNANGFSLGTDTTLVNASANSYVAWQWKAGGAAVSNTQGTITSQVSANTTAGFSIVTYTGNQNASATVGHGLGKVPSLIIVKQTGGATENWYVTHSSLSTNNQLVLNSSTNALPSSGYSDGGLASPNSSNTFSFINGSVNVDNVNNATTYVAYCFAEIAGFSKFGSYTGNGLADGPFVFCGFRPRFVMIKTSTTVENWLIYDSSRNSFNVVGQRLVANAPSEESTIETFDFTSNGFKLRTSDSGRNASGVTYIFAAFAEVPSKYALAR